MSTAEVTTIAGDSAANAASGVGCVDGPGSGALFNSPSGLAMDAAKSFVLIADQGNHRIRRLALMDPNFQVTTLAGTVTADCGSASGYVDGYGTNAKFNLPTDVAMDGAGSFALVVDSSNFVLRFITISSAFVTTFAGRSTSHSSSVDGVGTAATFNQPRGVALNQAGTLAVMTDLFCVRMIVMSSRLVSTLAGSTVYGSADGVGASVLCTNMRGISLNAAGTVALVADTYDGVKIRRIDIASATVSTVAGRFGIKSYADGVGSGALFFDPIGVALSANEDFALVVRLSPMLLVGLGGSHDCRPFLPCRSTD